jgi:ferrous iron transport protein B
MTAQQLTVFSVVLACSLYALWVLMPSAARRFLAGRLARLPLGTAWKTFFQQAASRSSGCDCSGCDKVVDKQTRTRSKVIRIHLQPRD